MRKVHWIIFLIIMLFPIAAGWFYPYMPQTMATHWGFNGQPDGCMSKFAGTFGVAIGMMIALLAGLVFDIIVTRKFSKTGGNPIRSFFDSSLLIFSLFLLALYVAVLVWNSGKVFNMTKFVFICVGFLLTATTAQMLFIVTRKSKQSEKTPQQTTSFTGQINEYKDSLIEISNDKIVFHNYYITLGDKTVKLCDLESVKQLPCTMRNGKWRLHGTGDFRTWFPADYARPSKDKIFVMKVRDKWMQIGFTVEHSDTVSQLFKLKGLLHS